MSKSKTPKTLSRATLRLLIKELAPRPGRVMLPSSLLPRLPKGYYRRGGCLPDVLAFVEVDATKAFFGLGGLTDTLTKFSPLVLWSREGSDVLRDYIAGSSLVDRGPIQAVFVVENGQKFALAILPARYPLPQAPGRQEAA